MPPRPIAVLALVLALVPGCSWNENRYVFGTELDRAGPLAVFWPADAEGRAFRYRTQGPPALGGGAPRARGTLASGAALESVELASALVLLPPDAADGLRVRARHLLVGLELEHPGLSTHVVVAREPFGALEREGELDDLLAGLAERAREERPRGPLGMWGDLGDGLALLTHLMSPSLLLAPAAGAPGELFAGPVRGSLLSGEPLCADLRRLDAASARELVERELARTPGEDEAPVFAARSVWVVLPADTPDEQRAALGEALAGLTAPGPELFGVWFVAGELAYADCDSPAAVAALLGELEER